jgi:signal transduction histidine kinase
MKYPDRLATRLSVSFVLLFVVTFAAVVAVTLYYAQRTFQTSIDDSLAGAAQAVDTRLQEPNNDPDHEQKVIDDLGTASQFIALLDSAGHLTDRSSSTPNSFQTQSASSTVRGKLNDVVQFHTINAGKSRLRTVRFPLLRDGTITGYVMVASPIPEVDDAIQSLAVLVIIAGLLGMTVAVVGTVWLSIREARPLKELTEDVRMTAATGFQLAVPRSREGSLEARELREAFATLVEKEREVITRERAFFADSSHVLRTPLAVLQGDIEQLEQGVYGKERLEVVAQARHSLGTMSRAVNGLLLLAREHEVAPGSTWEVVELGPLLERLVSEARVAAPGLTLSARVPASVVEVAGDPHQLNDLFASLIENACHYTPAGGSVEVTLATGDAEDAIVEVRDTGIGLSEADAAHLAERFYRGAAARRMFPGGSGLGLAIAERIARLHGGELTLRPAPGDGTIARVTLPLLS